MVRKIVKKALEKDLEEIWDDIDEEEFSGFEFPMLFDYDDEVMEEIMENKTKFEEINNDGTIKEIGKIAKYDDKKAEVISFNFNKQSDSALEKYIKELDSLVKKYIESMRKMRAHCAKLSKFIAGLRDNNPVNIEYGDQAVHSLLTFSDIENACKCSVLELAYKKQELKIFKQEERMKKLEKIIENIDKK